MDQTTAQADYTATEQPDAAGAAWMASAALVLLGVGLIASDLDGATLIVAIAGIAVAAAVLVPPMRWRRYIDGSPSGS